jgi:polar amino acid transport system substrate-binding protein
LSDSQEEAIMKRLFIMAIVLIVALAGCITTAPGGNIRIITEENPPFNFTDESGTVTGQSTEIIKEIAKKSGVDARIEIMPWSDGYALVQKDPNVMIYSIVRMPSREDMFKWVGPIGFDDEWFYAKRGADIKIASLDDAKKAKSIAVYRNDRNQLFLSEKGFTNLDISENDMECVKKLADGKVELWLGPSSGLHFIAYKAGVNPAELQPVSYVKRSEYYIAFNKNTPDSVIKPWQAALDEMKKSADAKTMSKYEQIITSYALPQYAASNVTRDQVVQLVENTAKDITADAPGTISKMNSRTAPYLDKTFPELYVYIYDKYATEIANASNPAEVGRSLKGVPDIAGRLFRDNIVDGALKNGSGWEDYVFTMPGKIGLFYKTAYYRAATGNDGKQYIVCSGLYKPAPAK